MVKGRIQHGLIESVGTKGGHVLHGKAEQPGFYTQFLSLFGQLKAKLGTAKLREGHLFMQKRAILSTQAENGFVPGLGQQTDLPV
ncbi:hypothetical protein SDC9_178056 [bioreactor metagenome]|uniref:Uncharacterized protein n=1 Tax=bioreactor metagenome TaxID=1076179 RepID=A0A645GUX9_9ZZZZ